MTWLSFWVSTTGWMAIPNFCSHFATADHKWPNIVLHDQTQPQVLHITKESISGSYLSSVLLVAKFLRGSNATVSYRESLSGRFEWCREEWKESNNPSGSSELTGQGLSRMYNLSARLQRAIYRTVIAAGVLLTSRYAYFGEVATGGPVNRGEGDVVKCSLCKWCKILWVQ